MKVTFPYVKKAGTNLIEYPNDIRLFKNTLIVDDNIVANYYGVKPLTTFTGTIPAFEKTKTMEQKIDDLIALVEYIKENMVIKMGG